MKCLISEWRKSDEDIKTGRLIDQDSLNEQELRWLNEKPVGLRQPSDNEEAS